MRVDDSNGSHLQHKLQHCLSPGDNSILCAASDDRQLYLGEGQEIIGYSLDTFSRVLQFSGHNGSVLGLIRFSYASANLLCSCSSDNTIRIWDLGAGLCKYIITSSYDVGDVFSIAWSAKWSTLYFGCQNTSIGWTSLKTNNSKTKVREADEDSSESRFFRSQSPICSPAIRNCEEICISEDTILRHAHRGYVYCLLIYSATLGDETLFSGGGDGQVIIWTILPSGLQAKRTLQRADRLAVLSMSFFNAQTLLVGSQCGEIKVYDLETSRLIRRNASNTEIDVLALASCRTMFYSADAEGVITQWSANFDPLHQWQAHKAPILTMLLSSTRDENGHPTTHLVTGGGRLDPVCKLWHIEQTVIPNKLISRSTSENRISVSETLQDLMAHFISYRSVSGSMKTREDCRQCAAFLKSTFSRLGAKVDILAAPSIDQVEARNPIVVAKFARSEISARRKHVLFYGHYDVVDATGQWTFPPFQMTGQDGYCYGRGVSDNKGPIIAVLLAILRVRDLGLLDFDITFVIEGEEENGSCGLKEAILTNKSVIGPVDVVLVSNSYWKDDAKPCLTYGLRGLIKATITVDSARRDLHSGVDGTFLAPEAMSDLVSCLAGLKEPNGSLNFPGFYDQIRPVTLEEEALYEPWKQGGHCGKEDHIAALMAKWRYPSFTIHKIDVSGPRNSTVIPSMAQASVSLRLVPDQVIEQVRESFVQSVRESFQKTNSTNHLTVSVDYIADWWVGDFSNEHYQNAARAIEEVWGQKPLFIREGGTIPAIRFLERQFEAPCVHIPLGQRSDKAHLPDERIRLENLIKGIDVFSEFFKNLSSATRNYATMPES